MRMDIAGAPPTALVVEDEAPVRELLRHNLVADRFSVIEADSGEAAEEALSGARPDVALIDIGLPGMSGLDLIGRIRAGGVDDPWDAGLPIILVTGDHDPHQAVRGLGRGADDHVTKPFHYPELLARIGAALRRARGAVATDRLSVGPIVVDRNARTVTLAGRVVDLSAKEYALLVALARDPMRVLTKAELLRDVWGYRSAGRTRTVDSHASRLRRKLARAGGGERYVHNVWGVGYRLLADDA